MGRGGGGVGGQTLPPPTRTGVGVSTPHTTHRDSHTALASKGQEKRKRGRSSACSSQREWEDGANGGPSWVGSLATGQMGHQRVPTGKILRFRRWQILIGLASLKSPETASRNVQYPLRAWLGAVVHNPKPTQTVGHRIFTAQRHWTICAGWVHSQRLFATFAEFFPAEGNIQPGTKWGSRPVAATGRQESGHAPLEGI